VSCLHPHRTKIIHPSRFANVLYPPPFHSSFATEPDPTSSIQLLYYIGSVSLSFIYYIGSASLSLCENGQGHSRLLAEHLQELPIISFLNVVLKTYPPPIKPLLPPPPLILKKMNSAHRHVLSGLFCYNRPRIDISGADTDASGAQQYLASLLAHRICIRRNHFQHN
jgi:hypothetical protein